MHTPMLFTLFLAFSIIINAQSHQVFSTEEEILLSTEGLATSYQNETGGSFKPERVHLVAYNEQTGNYLFRGNMPLNSETFAYDELLGIMNVRSQEELGALLPESVKIIDVSLVNSIEKSEKRHLEKERSFFAQNPELGEVINRPIYGIPISVKHTHRKWRKHFSKKWGKDKLESLINNLSTWLNKNQDIPVIIYVHCEAGFDRTGEVIAAYQLRFQGKSYHEAYQNAVEVAGRNISSFSKHGLQWYAYYLREVTRLPTIGDIQ
ncbi:dual specificity protein phosphatase family protein [Endozoicomonas atrinae]|uniref:dual specificity protein phosphatase family protein n=2 Tax=Endozoicomonas atrinae TaxID=1333660 RepID=UPI0008253E38|nr:dual specificity protein phosphatase family protein [Endozoicomonas atrinae]